MEDGQEGGVVEVEDNDPPAPYDRHVQFAEARAARLDRIRQVAEAREAARQDVELEQLPLGGAKMLEFAESSALTTQRRNGFVQAIARPLQQPPAQRTQEHDAIWMRILDAMLHNQGGPKLDVDGAHARIEVHP